MDTDSELSSQLTDEDELDQEYSAQPQASRTATKKKGRSKSSVHQDNEYALQNALKPPRATTYTAQALFEQIHLGDIDLDPEYQRDVVWTKEKQTQLIDSILRNYYIPPIIFAVTVHADGSESRVCIDGKQRLTSIRLFMDGMIPHKDSHTGQQFWYKDNPGKTGRKTLLPQKYRTMFANKQVVCVEYGELRQCDERDIFRRVQLGVALTPAEKLQAISTPRADFIRELLNQYNTDETLGHPDISWDRERARDYHVFALAVYSLDRWKSNGKGKNLALAGIQQIEKWLAEKVDAPTSSEVRKTGRKKKKINPDHGDEYDDDDDDGEYGEIPPAFKKKVEEAFEFTVKVATDRKYNLPFRSTSGFSTKVAPIEMAGIIMLAYVTQSTLGGDLKRFSELITCMRTQLREEHSDVRMNSRVGRSMFDFVFGAGRDPWNFSGLSSSSGTIAEQSSKGKGKGSGKKRTANGDDSESDYELQTKKQPKKKGRYGASISQSSVLQVAKRTPSTKAPLTPSATPTTESSAGTANPQRLPSPNEMSGGGEVKGEPSSPGFPSTPNTDVNMIAQMMAPGYNSSNFMPNMSAVGGMPAQMAPQVLASWMQAFGSGLYMPQPQTQSGQGGGGGSAG